MPPTRLKMARSASAPLPPACLCADCDWPTQCRTASLDPKSDAAKALNACSRDATAAFMAAFVRSVFILSRSAAISSFRASTFSAPPAPPGASSRTSKTSTSLARTCFAARLPSAAVPAFRATSIPRAPSLSRMESSAMSSLSSPRSSELTRFSANSPTTSSGVPAALHRDRLRASSTSVESWTYSCMSYENPMTAIADAFASAMTAAAPPRALSTSGSSSRISATADRSPAPTPGAMAIWRTRRRMSSAASSAARGSRSSSFRPMTMSASGSTHSVISGTPARSSTVVRCQASSCAPMRACPGG